MFYHLWRNTLWRVCVVSICLWFPIEFTMTKQCITFFKVYIRTQNPVKAYFVYVGFSLQGLLPAREASIPQDTGADTHRNPCTYNSAQDTDSGCRRGGAGGRRARKEETDPKVSDCSDNREPVTSPQNLHGRPARPLLGSTAAGTRRRGATLA